MSVELADRPTIGQPFGNCWHIYDPTLLINFLWSKSDRLSRGSDSLSKSLDVILKDHLLSNDDINDIKFLELIVWQIIQKILNNSIQFRVCF